MLPCNCRIAYCAVCWDRSLAQSFNRCGQARCPTCVTPVRVDFDASGAAGAGKLVFSRDTAGDMTYLKEMEALGARPHVDGIVRPDREHAAVIAAMRGETIERLLGQAAPSVARRLVHFGEVHPFLRALAADPVTLLSDRSTRELKTHLEAMGGDPEGCLEKADIVAKMVEVAHGQNQLAASWAAAAAEDEAVGPQREWPKDLSRSPPCICGGKLVRMSLYQRSKWWLEQQNGEDMARTDPALVEAWLRSEVASTCSGFGLVCDLCHQKNWGEANNHTWTCLSGTTTIFHATCYDVCDSCFARHAVQGICEPRIASNPSPTNVYHPIGATVSR